MRFCWPRFSTTAFRFKAHGWSGLTRKYNSSSEMGGKAGAGVQRGFDEDSEIDVAFLDRVKGLLRPCRGRFFTVNSGKLSRNSRSAGGRRYWQDGRVGSNMEPALFPILPRLQPGPRPGHFSSRIASAFREQFPAGGGESDLARCAFQQPAAEILLQSLEAVADRGGGQRQLLGRPAEIKLASHGDEDAEMLCVDDLAHGRETSWKCGLRGRRRAAAGIGGKIHHGEDV